MGAGVNCDRATVLGANARVLVRRALDEVESACLNMLGVEKVVQKAVEEMESVACLNVGVRSWQMAIYQELPHRMLLKFLVARDLSDADRVHWGAMTDFHRPCISGQSGGRGIVVATRNCKYNMMDRRL